MTSLQNIQSMTEHKNHNEDQEFVNKTRKLDTPRQSELEIYSFVPSEEPNFHEENALHMYIASNQFHKKFKSGRGSAKPEIESIVYVENRKILERFENCKREFVEKGVSDKELLLFHGTDASNLDNIFTSNFKIDFQPINRPKKMMHGRGIYMAENPEMCLHYGDKIILSRVLLGGVLDNKEVISGGIDSKFYVINTEDQILPYCIINLKHRNSPSFFNPAPPLLPPKLSNIPIFSSMSTNFHGSVSNNAFISSIYNGPNLINPMMPNNANGPCLSNSLIPSNANGPVPSNSFILSHNNGPGPNTSGNNNGPGPNNSGNNNGPGPSNSGNNNVPGPNNLITSIKSSCQSSVISSNRVQTIMTSNSSSGNNQGPSCQMSAPPPYPVSTCQNTSSDTNAEAVAPGISSHSRFSDHIPKDPSTSDSKFDKDMPIVDMIQMYLDNMP